MKKQAGNINKEDYQKYLADKMSNSERFDFERQLQENPFETEAMEGMQLFNTDEVTTDLNELNKKITQKKHKTKIPFLAAASVLLVITSSIIFFLLNNNNPIQTVSENIFEKNMEHNKSNELNKPEEIKPDIISEKKALLNWEESKVQQPESKANPKPKTSKKNSFIKPKKSQQTIEIVESNNELKPELILDNKDFAQNTDSQTIVNIILPSAEKNNNMAFAQAPKLEEKQPNFIEGKTVSAPDNLPVPEASIIVRETNTGAVSNIQENFKVDMQADTDQTFVTSFTGIETTKITNDTDNKITRKPSTMAIDEVIENGRREKGMKKYRESLHNSKAQPTIGFLNYNKYLEGHCILPEGLKSKKRMVKLALTINPSGEIIQVDALNLPAPELFELAKNIVLAGSSWKAELKNGKPVESKAIIKIRFSEK